MSVGNETAAICGLFCGTCPSYPDICGGCLSTRVAPGCDDCGSGFRDCANAHGVTRCYECTAFPCTRLEKFSHRHIENGVCHHAHVISDLRRMKEAGVDVWVAQQTAARTCPTCGKLIPWFVHNCPVCYG